MTEIEECLEYFETTENEMGLGLHSTYVLGKRLAAEVRQLQQALSGRTVSCSNCNRLERELAESQARALALQSHLFETRNVLMKLKLESRIQDWLDSTRKEVDRVLTLNYSPSWARAVVEVVQAAKNLRGTFPASHIWSHEQCMLDVALQAIDSA